MSDEPTVKKLSVYHMDPTNPRPYKMDRRKYNKIIAHNLKMNEDLVMTPDDERYHLREKTATKDLSSTDRVCMERIKDWDAKVSPTKYKAYRNNRPGKNGAPYDYSKYLPE